MAINAINGPDEMNKLTEASIANRAAAPAVDEVVSLREAAIQLAMVVPSKKKGEKIADAKLLQLLKAEKLHAGFHAPGIGSVWVPIPSKYWLKISGATFRKIRIGQSNRLKGEYKVRLRPFASEYAAARLGTDRQPPSAEHLFHDLVEHESDFFEVMLPVSDWEDYKRTLPEILTEFVQDDESRNKSGRNKLASWKDANAILAAYLLKREIRSSDDESCESIARNVLDIAKRMNGELRLPATATFQKEVSRVLALVDSPEFDSISAVNSFRR
ncbi:hypothetical protein ACVME8_002023 [Bradyrhizobium diazoefficiens]|uniref:hypothetical protein n=1 Tax=Bradyrhizobium diazoefficiens TaxID=1355477 RepID=UPI00272C3BEC|nr:hypothetical protein [Bradyrhizobium diazoefficiens]WLA64710.1 hypothetical protein QNN01_41710 [Bradyrhizobium diazoefficiens]